MREIYLKTPLTEEEWAEQHKPIIPPVNDAVSHPSHYCQGGIECIDAIKASMSTIEYQGYLKGNAEKYLWRWRNKGGLEDLKKAKVYLDWLIKTIEEVEK